MTDSSSSRPAPDAPATTPGSLVAFDTQALAQEVVDVVVIGGGVAGLSAALAAAEGGKRVLVIVKQIISESTTTYAQGGIAVPLGGEDALDSHIADTLDAGRGLCDESVVREIIGRGPAALTLLRELGAQFDTERASRELSLTIEGGHSQARVLHAGGDATGREIQRALTTAAFNHQRILLVERTYVVELLQRSDADAPGKRRCCGVLVHSANGLRVIWAETVVLATGGAGAMYRETSNPAGATGDGLAVALRAGATMRDLEFVQFHPTVLYVAGSARVLVTEAIRGEGGLLRDGAGRRYMLEHDPRAELAPRDIVSRATFQHMRTAGEPHVWLDVTHLDAAMLAQRFPTFIEHCRLFNLDVANEWIPVLPAAHYTIGGVKAASVGETSLAGLLAAGEVSSSGLHGANRLGSNSLLEGLVMGLGAGERAARESHGVPTGARVTQRGPGSRRAPIDLADLNNSLRALLWRHLGVRREREPMAMALRRIRSWARYALSSEFDGPAGWTLQNQLILAGAMFDSALWREESRGVHYRADFPERNDDRFAVHHDVGVEAGNRTHLESGPAR